MTRRYSDHDAFIRPARARSEIWRFVVGLGIAAMGYLTLNQIYFTTIYQAMGSKSQALYVDLTQGSRNSAAATCRPFMILSAFSPKPTRFSSRSVMSPKRSFVS